MKSCPAGKADLGNKNCTHCWHCEKGKDSLAIHEELCCKCLVIRTVVRGRGMGNGREEKRGKDRFDLG